MTYVVTLTLLLCKHGKAEVAFLSHTISASGICPLTCIEAVRTFPVLRTRKHCTSCLASWSTTNASYPVVFTLMTSTPCPDCRQFYKRGGGGGRVISGITRLLGEKKGGISRNWEPQRGYHWKLWKDSEGGPLKFAWKLSHGGITKVIKSYKGGSLQWSKIQRGEKLNFTLFSPKSSALSPSPPPPPHHAINNDRSLKARELARDPDVLISVSYRSPRLPPASTTFLSQTVRS